jgi:hypothetical protein
MLEVYEQHSRRKLIATTLAVMVIAGSILFADNLKHTTAVARTATIQNTASNTSSVSQTANVALTPTSIPPVAPTASNPAPTPTPGASGYRDGTFNAAADYSVPRSTENIQVTLTLKDGAISNASVTNSEGDDQSASYQQDFASVFKSYVVGKKIADLKFGIIAGASDTTQGFSDALSQIASKAKA